MIRRWEYRKTVVTLCTLAFFVTMVARLVISPVVPAVVETFNTSSSVVGLALTGMWLAYACAQFPSGVLATRYGERTIILTSVTLTAFASTLLALSPSVLTFVFLTVVLGAAAGLHYSVATTFLAKKFENIGTAIGLHNSGAPIAGVLAPPAAAIVAAWANWRISIALSAFVAVPIAFLFAWKIRPTTPVQPTRSFTNQLSFTSIRRLLTRPRIVFTGLLAVLFEFVWTATASFLPTFLITTHGYSATVASVLFSLYFIAQGLTQPGIGTLSDRYGREEITAACAFAGAIGYGFLIMGSGTVIVTAAILLAGTAMGWGAALLPRFMDYLPAEERSAGFGLVRTSYMSISSTGSVVVGSIAMLANWSAAFGVFVVFLVAICILLGCNRVFDLGL